MIEVIPLSAHVGAEVRGVDVSREIASATKHELYAAWLKHLVLVIRDQKLSADDQRRFDSYYSRWLQYRATNNQGEILSMENRMRDVYAHNGIPSNVPFDQVASPSVRSPNRY